MQAQEIKETPQESKQSPAELRQRLVELIKSRSPNNLKTINSLIQQIKAYPADISFDHEQLTVIRDLLLEPEGEFTLAAMRSLLAAGLSPVAPLTRENSHAFTSLFSVVVESGNFELLKLFHEKNLAIKNKEIAVYATDKYAIEEFNERSKKAMQMAVKYNRVEMVEYLLNHECPANGVYTFDGANRQTFLGRAASEGFQKIVSLLVEHGASVHDALAFNKQCYNPEKLDYWIERFKLVAGSEDDVTELKEEIEKLQQLKEECTRAVKILMDHAMGMNLSAQKFYGLGLGRFNELEQLYRRVDLSYVNFIGVSLNGKPMTHEMLKKAGLEGADKALITLEDLEALSDPERKAALKIRLQKKQKEQGTIVDDNGIVNLVPLSIAVKMRDEETIKVHLKAGVSPNETPNNLSKKHSLIVATEKGYVEMVKCLATHPDIDKKIVKEAATITSDPAIKAFLLNTLGLKEVDMTDARGETLLHREIRRGNVEEVRNLIRRGADVNLKNNAGHSPLSIATIFSVNYSEEFSQNHIEIINILLENNAKADFGLLKIAAKNGNAGALRLLIPHIEKKEVKDPANKVVMLPWYVPLMHEAISCHLNIEILKILKEHEPNLDLNIKYSGTTILHRLIVELPEFIITEDPSQEERYRYINKRCMQAYREAFERIKTVLVYLLDNGANRSIRDLYNQTPLDVLGQKRYLLPDEREYVRKSITPIQFQLSIGRGQAEFFTHSSQVSKDTAAETEKNPLCQDFN